MKLRIFLIGSLVLALTASPALAEPVLDVTPEPTIVQTDSVPRRSTETDGSSAVQNVASAPATSSVPTANDLFLLQIQNRLKDSYQDYRSLNGAISDGQQRVNDLRGTLGTLRDQLTQFQTAIDESTRKIAAVSDQIGVAESDIAQLETELSERVAAFEQQKSLVADYMRVTYMNEQRFGEVTDHGTSFDPLTLLLSDQDVNTILDRMKSLDILQHTGLTMLDKLAVSQAVVADMKTDLESKRGRLTALRDSLLGEQQTLTDQKMTQARLIQATRGEQSVYESLVAESLKQEDETLLQIAALQQNFSLIRDRIGKLGGSVSARDIQMLLDSQTKAMYDYQQLSDGATFAWPVAPSRGISAYFRDGAYKARFGLEHRAIDIPTLQGSPVRAPKDGYVYRTKDNGMGYSYIILSHKDDLMTVYGHVSSILVKEGQFVPAGTVIALSGGLPGTSGAGYLTTGPHLHFEVLKGGSHVDPLNYLSIAPLPLDTLPAKYLDRVTSRAGGAVDGVFDGLAARDGLLRDGLSRDGLSSVPSQTDSALEQTANEERDAYQRIFGGR